MSSSSLSKTLYRYGRDPVSMTLLVCVIVSAVITFLSLAFLLGYILLQGIPNINLDLFAFEYNTENVSLFPALVDTVIMVLLALAIATPLGIFAAIYLVEYASRDNKIVGVVRVTADTLSGIPSIVYGLFGMLFFVTYLKWSYSLLAGSCTVAIMILPLIMRTTEEALKAIPELPRRQLRPWCRQTAHGICNCSAFCHSRHSGRRNSRHWPYCRRNRSAYVYLRYRCSIAAQRIFVRPYSGSAYVRTCQRRTFYETGLCNGCYTCCNCNCH